METPWQKTISNKNTPHQHQSANFKLKTRSYRLIYIFKNKLEKKILDAVLKSLFFYFPMSGFQLQGSLRICCCSEKCRSISSSLFFFLQPSERLLMFRISSDGYQYKGLHGSDDSPPIIEKILEASSYSP